MNFLKIKQGALALAFVCVGIFTTGCCAGTYEVLDSQTEQELATVNLNDAKIIINQVEAGKYVSGNKTYDKSGFINLIRLRNPTTLRWWEEQPTSYP